MAKDVSDVAAGTGEPNDIVIEPELPAYAPYIFTPFFHYLA